MAGYRNVSVSFWTDSKVDDDFTPEDKYFYLYLMTNPHTSICGCFEISMKQMERETGYNTDTVKRLLNRLENQHGVIRYSESTKEVLIVNWHKYNWSSSSKVQNAIISVADHIKNKQFRKYVMDMVSIRYQYTMDTTDTDTVSESDTESESDTDTEYRSVGARASRVPDTTQHIPTVEDVEKYCKEIGSIVDPNRFINYYAAAGWKFGNGKKIVDWKALVRMWDDKDKKKKQKAAGNSSIDMTELEQIIGKL